MELAIVIIILVLATIIAGAKVVRQQDVAIVERLGKYNKSLGAGFHVIIPYIDRVAATVPLRVQQNDLTVETKTKDNVFCKIAVSVQYRVNPTKVEDSFYKLQRPVAQIESYIQDAVRSAVPNLELDAAFERKDDIAKNVQETVKAGMSDYGFIIVNTLITEVNPDAKVKASMNEINAAQRTRAAAQELAEADRIKKVTAAKADAESAKLRGEGLAAERQAIVDGLVRSVKGLRASGISEDNVLVLLMQNQYMNTMETVAGSSNKGVIFMDSGADASDNLKRQILQGMEATKISQ